MHTHQWCNENKFFVSKIEKENWKSFKNHERKKLKITENAKMENIFSFFVRLQIFVLTIFWDFSENFACTKIKNRKS